MTVEATAAARPPVARGARWALLAATALVHLPAIARYGWFRDELYYVSCARRLAWGYVDQPPLSIALLALWRLVARDSLVGMRLVPLAAHLALVWLTIALARALGGGRFAQACAGAGAMGSLIYLGVGHYYSMNALDLVFWALAALALLRALERGRTRDWAWLGLAVGGGLLNKLSMLWCAGGLAAGVLATPRRRALATPGPWLAAGIAALLFAPHVAWQVANHWPTLEFVRNATAHKMVAVSAGGYFSQQLLVMNPLFAPLWLTGLVRGLRGRGGADGRVFAIQYVAVFALLVVTGKARADYLSPAYPPLLALGGVAFERATARAGRGWLRVPAVALPLAGMLALLPLALPVLGVPAFERYQAALGRKPATEERHDMGPLPQHYADMFGWPELEQAVARACATLTPDERRRAVIYAQDYGQAGAIELFGARDHLPPVVCGHNNWWLWGPRGADGSVIVVIGGDDADEHRDFERYEVITRFDHPLVMPYERHLDVGVGRGLKFPLASIWPRLKVFT